MTAPQVVIVGGGISGLTAAYELHDRGIPFVLVERAPRCGGVVLTERIGNFVIDAGPDALLAQKPVALQLAERQSPARSGSSPRDRESSGRSSAGPACS